VVVVGLLVLVWVGAGGFYLWWKRTPPLEALLPQNVALVVAADAAWWWDALKDLRQQPDVRRVLADVERDLGLSLEEDLFSWVGQVGVGVLGVGRRYPELPELVVCAQVRDWRALLDRITQLRSKAEKKAEASWSETSYNGVSLYRMTVRRRYQSDVVVEAGVVKGWVIVGIGEGATEKVIDAWQGRAPSLKQSAAWTQAFAHLPSQRVAWWGMNAQELLRESANSEDSVGFFGLGSVELSLLSLLSFDSVTVTALRAESDGLQLHEVSVPLSEETRNLLRELKAKMKPLQGNVLQRLPEGTVFAVAFSNPDGWVEYFETAMREVVRARGERYEMDFLERDLREIEPLRDVLRRFPGECGAALVWEERFRFRRFGFLLMGEAKSESAAREAAQDLARLWEREGERVETRGDFFTLPNQGICWRVKDKWLTLSTNPRWLWASLGESKLQLPKDSREAMVAGVGSLRFLPSLLNQLEQEARYDSERDSERKLIASCRKLQLERAQGEVRWEIAPQGNWQKTVVNLSGWQWRQALKNVSGLVIQVSEQDRQVQCQSNLKQLSLGILMYVQDYDGRYPLAHNWAAGIDPYVKNAGVFRCPSRPDQPVGYAFNSNLGGQPYEGVESPAGTVMLFDSSAGRTMRSQYPYQLPSPADTGESWLGIHNGGANVVYADGHVKWHSDKSKSSLRWDVGTMLNQLPMTQQNSPTSSPPSSPSSIGLPYVDISPFTRQLTEQDLIGKSRWELRLMRNAIFARYGRPFVKQELKDFFSKQPWYRPDPNWDDAKDDARISELDKANAAFIRDHEKRVYGQ